MDNKKKCVSCGYYAGAIFCCLHPDNEGIRAFAESNACEKHRDFSENPLTEDEKNDFFKHLFG